MKIKKNIFKDVFLWATVIGFTGTVEVGFLAVEDDKWPLAWSWWILLGIYIIFEAIYIYYKKTYFRKNPELDEFLGWNILLFIVALFDNVVISPFILGFRSIMKELYNILVTYYIVVIIIIGIILLKVCVWNIFFNGKK